MADPNLPVPAAGAVAVGESALDTTSPASFGAAEWKARFDALLAQPAIRRALPLIIGVGVVGVLAALYLMIAQGPQRILYSSLSDGERAQVVEVLERGGIGYVIDPATGMLTVAEDDLYRARMLVASDAGLAAPQGASEMLDAIPLGSSRTLEGERLRLARERELMLTILEIDGIESVRVHLATPERSVFVRQNNPPSASVMVRLVGGRSLSQAQVEAIVNLVSGSVPGMTADAVRVVDQNGRLLSSAREGSLDALVLQREFEAKLREQVSGLLLPLLGEGNFSSQVQVELDQSEVTSARESYDQEGSVRSESERTAMRMAAAGPGGIPGVTANTPPPDAELVDGPPIGDDVAEGEQAMPPSDSERAMRRDYELGREVAVTSTRPGGMVKLSVAVAVSETALADAAPLTLEQLQSLVGAAVGADPDRGDMVQVVASAFQATEMAPMAFYEQPWFATLIRYVAALVAVLLVLLLAVRPLLKSIRSAAVAEAPDSAVEEVARRTPKERPDLEATQLSPIEQSSFTEQVQVVRQFAATEPDRAADALRRMLDGSPTNGEEAAA